MQRGYLVGALADMMMVTKLYRGRSHDTGHVVVGTLHRQFGVDSFISIEFLEMCQEQAGCIAGGRH